MGRGAEGLRRPETRSVRHRRRVDRVVPRAAGALQSAQARGIRFPAAHRYRQDPEERTARAGARGAGSTMTMEHITAAREGAIAIVTLNRPQRRNALSL